MTKKPTSPTVNMFMTVMVATAGGRPVTQFNTIVRQFNRNVTTADLQRMQNAGAKMLVAEGVEFDNIVIHNIFHLYQGKEAGFHEEANELMSQQADEIVAAQMAAEEPAAELTQEEMDAVSPPE